MNACRWIPLTVAAACAVAPVLPAQTADSVPALTLAEARRLAAAADPAAVASRAALRIAAWERRAALADLFTPNVFAATNFTKYNEPFFSFTGTPSSTTAFATLEARYDVLGSGKLAELRSARASIASAEAGATAAGFRTALATDAAYYAVLAERDLSRVAAERLRRAVDQLGLARVRVQAGETIATDSLRLLLEVNRARLEVLRRDSALAVSRLRLGRQIGRSGSADAAPIDTGPPPPLPLSLEAASAELRSRGPELQAARAEERRAAARLGAERSGYLPDVSLSATHVRYDSDFFPAFLKRNSIGITVSLPLWDAGRREQAVARARGLHDVSRALREERERATAEQMAQAWNGYRTASAGIELAQVGITVSTENYRVQRARYREGAATILDLLEAQVELTEAEATLIQARYATRLALAQIESLLGRRLFDAPSP